MERAGLSLFVLLGFLLVFLVSASNLGVEGAVSDFSGGVVVQGENKVVHSTADVVLESTNYVAAADKLGWFTFEFNATPKMNGSAVDLVIVSSEDIQAEIDVWRNASRTYNSTSCSESGIVFANGTQAGKITCINSSSTVVGFNWSLVAGSEFWSSGRKEVRFGPLSSQKDVPVGSRVRIRNFPRGNVYKFDFCVVPSGVNLSVARDARLGGCLDPSASGALTEALWLDCGGSPNDKANNLTFTANSMTYGPGHHGNGGCVFDGSVGYLNRADNDMYSYTNKYSVSFWVRLRNQDTQQYAWYKDAGGNGLLINFMDSSGQLRVFHDPGTIDTSTQSADSGIWGHFVISFNGTHVTRYKNGVPGTPVAFSTFLDSGSGPQIGFRSGCGVGDCYLDGNVSDYRHYNFSLNSTEVSLLFDGGNGTNQSLYDLVYGAASQSASEVQGDVAIEAGINSSLPLAVKYGSRQVYVRNLSNNHTLGRFDWVASYGSQRWLINYITSGEGYVRAPNLTTAVYVLEIADKTSVQITDEVGRFINSTRTG